MYSMSNIFVGERGTFTALIYSFNNISRRMKHIHIKLSLLNAKRFDGKRWEALRKTAVSNFFMNVHFYSMKIRIFSHHSYIFR